MLQDAVHRAHPHSDVAKVLHSMRQQEVDSRLNSRLVRARQRLEQHGSGQDAQDFADFADLCYDTGKATWRLSRLSRHARQQNDENRRMSMAVRDRDMGLDDRRDGGELLKMLEQLTKWTTDLREILGQLLKMFGRQSKQIKQHLVEGRKKLNEAVEENVMMPVPKGKGPLREAEMQAQEEVTKLLDALRKATAS